MHILEITSGCDKCIVLPGSTQEWCGVGVSAEWGGVGVHCEWCNWCCTKSRLANIGVFLVYICILGPMCALHIAFNYCSPGERSNGLHASGTSTTSTTPAPPNPPAPSITPSCCHTGRWVSAWTKCDEVDMVETFVTTYGVFCDFSLVVGSSLCGWGNLLKVHMVQRKLHNLSIP